MQYLANLLYRQNKQVDERRERVFQDLQDDAVDRSEASEQSVAMEFFLEVPAVFAGQCDIHQYNLVLRNEPYTALLQRFFAKSAVPDPLLDTFSKLDLNYRLPEPVINVLIHYLHVLNKSWTKAFIESIASDMLAKRIATYEQAVTYVREQLEVRRSKRGSSAEQVNKRRPQKPKMTVQTTHHSNDGGHSSLSPDQLAEWQQMAAQLDKPKT
jgi:replication initiation and membrane attachment protein